MRDGNVAPNPSAFGQSWKLQNIPGCTELGPGTCPGLGTIEAQQRTLSGECGLLLAKKGPFRECHKKVDPEGYFQDCVSDYCSSQGQPAVICKALASYVLACQAAGATLYAWRSDSFCSLPCAPNSHYELCASDCAQTCGSIYVPIPCTGRCQESCVCDQDFVRSGDQCVPISERAREDGKMSVSKMVSVSVHGVTLTFLKNKPGQVKVDDTLQLLPVTLSGGRLRAHPHGTRVLSKLTLASFTDVPANSHYEFCADLCSISCAKITDPGNCPSTCAEGCQCDDGFFFDGRACVTAENCGCLWNGHYFKPHEKVLLNNCRESCTCIPGRGVKCEAQRCTADEECVTKDGVMRCIKKGIPLVSCGSVQCRKQEVCKIQKGRPVCVPQSESTCWAQGYPHYHTFDGRSFDFMGTCTYTIAKTCGSGSTLPSFTVEAKNEIRGGNKHVAYVNYQRSQLPISLREGETSGLPEWRFAWIGTDFALKVAYDWSSYLVVTVPSIFSGSLCGLCGDYNGDPANDFRTPDGSLAPSPAEFGQSWKVQDGKGEMARFSLCHSVLDPSIFLDNCVNDLCLTDGLRQSLCQALKSYADACRRRGVTVSDWRTASGCTLPCPENSQYKACAAPCPATCNDLARPSNCDSLPCVGSCQCNDSFVLDAGKCIPKASCGCIFEGKLFSPGEQFWGDGTCSRRCICDPRSKQGNVTISASTVRGLTSRGTCLYQLTGLCARRDGLENFLVLVQNDRRGSKTVSFTKVVDINIYGNSIVISREQPAKVMVNGFLINLPYRMGNNKVSIYREGQEAVVQTDFFLTVTFDWQSRITVSVPSTYAGALCGLCGNFNGNKGDDLIMRDGNVAPNPSAFGQPAVICKALASYVLACQAAGATLYAWRSDSFCRIPQVSCGSVQCRKQEVCKIQKGRPVCVPQSESTCWAQGYPHYHTFDGRSFDFMGTCTYTIAKTCGSGSTLPSFTVEAKNEIRGGNKHIAYVGLVTVRVYNTVISVARNEMGFVRVNYQRSQLPISLREGKLQVYQSGGLAWIGTDFALKVAYDWSSYLVVTVPSIFSGSLCGLCGDYNGDPANDFRTPDGSLAPSPAEFGQSWKVQDGDRFCQHAAPPPKSCPSEGAHKYKAEAFCGLIRKGGNGPFSLCHSVLDPSIFLDNCVNDLCLTDGLRQSLCQALKSYADACRRRGVTVSDWRTASGCTLPCPENSQYKACAAPCPATCNDLARPSNCDSLPCVGSCQCNDGFVLDAGKCIPKASCGCIFEGKLFSPGEQFWGDGTCSRRCICDPRSKQVTCKTTGCKSGEQCRVEKGIQNCYPTSSGTCSISGQRHYLSFDGQRFDFQGTCLYQLTGLCARRDGLENFLVLVQNDRRGSKTVSFTKVVDINIYGNSIVISREQPAKVMVNGFLINLPYRMGNNKVSIYRRGQEAVVQTDFFLTVTFDWQSRITVSVPSTYAGALCGLCGNFNGNKGDDLIMRDGNVAPNPSAFGQSWKLQNIPGCTELGPGTCPGLGTIEAQQRTLSGECGLLLAKKGPFRECHKKVDPEGYFQDCVSDYCSSQGQPAVICKALASYVLACQAAGATLYAWRSDSFCSLPCAPNSHYELCASDCAQTCGSIYVPIPCTGRCQESCVCDQDFVRSGDQCVPISRCGCYYQERYYLAGETFYPTCQERCRCQEGGTVNCEAFSCGPNEDCGVENGIQKCYPVGSATCSVAGGVHYLSFDQVPFDFHGTCTYTLAKTKASSQNLTPFTVNVENGAREDGKMSVSKMVSVSVHGVTLTFLKNKPGQVKVDDTLQLLPVTLSGGRLRAHPHGTRVLVQADFGLIVSYDFASRVTVTVPSNYQDGLSGLCGNYNDQKGDEFLLPDGRAVTDVNTFGAAWKVLVPGADGSCLDGCPGNKCPVCDERQKEVLKQRKYCGILSADDGPLSACHAAVDPKVYLSNCIYDSCLVDGDREVLCQSIQSYVSACQDAAVSFDSWRTPSFCPLTCPANSHYEFCADLCSISCAKITDPGNCPSTCAEGCQCDDGFFFDGRACVTAENCGCLWNGHYFKPHEKVLLNNCRESCTCIPGRGVKCEAQRCTADEECVTKDGVMRCIKKGIPQVSCGSVQCRKQEVCKIQKGRPVCVPQSESTCWAQGYPHYHTFDGRSFDFMGTCTYTIAKTCGSGSTLPSFTVEAKNEIRGGNKHIAYVGLVTVRVYNTVISVARNEMGFVRVNYQRSQLPISLREGKLQVYQSGGLAWIGTDFALKVAYDWSSYLVVTVPSIFSGSLCGLCGDYNGDPANDFRTPDGSLAPSPAEFGQSWKVQDGDRFCQHAAPPPKSCPSEGAHKYKAEAFCGLIRKGGNGPFSLCHSVLDPSIFLDNCVNDLCLTDGLRQSLCQALKSYADACRRRGVTVSDWRTASGCTLPCPENSQYKACAAPCPATCNDLARPSNCDSLPCVGSCQCNDGFVLDAGKCIPKASCGCIFEGKLFSPGEQFWGDGTCSRRCICDPRSKQVTCKTTGCKSGEQCRVEKGIQNCYPTSSGTCSISGQRHYLSFDGQRFDFQGTCLYQLTGLCARRDGLENFLVLVQNDRRGSKTVSFTKVVDINIYGNSIVISREQPAKVMVNGFLINLPYRMGNNKVSIYRRGQEAVVQTDFFLTVTFDWQSRITVSVPSTYAGALCGLCGNFNGNKGDDLIMRDGNVAPNPSAFGQSWKLQNIPGCTELGPGTCPGLGTIEAQQRTFSGECGLLLAKKGPFRECHKKVDPEGYFQDCVSDYCSSQGQPAVICKALASYVLACQAAGATLYAWRSDSFCSLPCAPNSHYELCASDCAQTCGSIYVPIPCTGRCQESCVCDQDFVRSGDQCVPISRCGCYYQERYYLAGETFYPTCQERCRCQEGGTVNCEAFSCGPNEDCGVENGIQKCYPVGSATCSVAGGVHYLSFDQVPFDFHGTCTYTLAKTKASSQNLTPFTVNVENGAREDGKMSVSKMVSVSVHGVTLTFLKNKPGQVKVDDTLQLLPVTLSGGRLRAHPHGTRVLVQADFGLIVSYDFASRVTVTVPSNYQDGLSGLCGNYNDQKGDEFLLPDGRAVTDVNTFGAAWKVLVPGADGSCLDGCPGNKCPVCDERQKEVLKQRKYCGILSADDGPLSACHAAVDPKVYLSNCIYDSCLVDGDREVLCQSIQSYVSACQDAAVSFDSWRTPSFCPLTCPANSHYEFCADLCSISCAKITDPGNCPSTCAEGCQCDDGFFFDGRACVTAENCGCLWNGHYFKPHEKVLLNNCRESCTCIPGRGVKCEAQRCTADEECVTKDGVMRCIKKGIPQVSCGSVQCRKQEVCKIQKGRPVCVPQSESTCWAQGYPHYHTFDGRSFDFMGTCTYTIAKTCGSGSTLPSFTVEAKNEIRGGNKHVAYVGLVTVRVYNTVISVARNEMGFVRVNYQRSQLPISLREGKLQVYQSGGLAWIGTDFALKVAYDWSSYLVVTVPSIFSGSLCGLCGDYNGDPANDFRTPDGSLAPSPAEFGQSWKVQDGDRFCQHAAPPPKSCPSEGAHKYKAEAFCGLIRKGGNGPFSLCHSVLDPSIFLDNCVNDLCLTDGLRQSLCQALKSYADACRRRGVTVSDWRTASGCTLPCPENSQYKACAAPCPATCNDLARPSNCDSLPCVGSCQCNDGFVLDAGKCIPKASCGCIFEGKLFSPGEQFWGDGTCSRRCICDPRSKQVTCKTTGCKSGEQCRVEKGIQNCYPTSSGTCSISGQRHYLSFDGQRFDFQGTCLYQLTGLCARRDGLENFLVLVQNDRRGSKTVSFTKVVDINIYGNSIVISREQPAKVMVNGFLINLPYRMGNNKVSIYRRGQEAVVQTDFFLTVTFDWQSRITVSVPSTYAGALCGLCGNFNGNKGDDLIMRDGNVAPNPSAFGQSWKLQNIPGCTELGPGTCPGLGTIEAQQRTLSGECGLLLAKKGPFRECHKKVDPEGYFQDCVSDYCSSQGQPAVICKALASYVLACQAAGATLYAWRSDSFCSLPCAPNSHYELCASDCAQTCGSIYVPIPCTGRCQESCVCDQDFVRSGDQCVPISRCGCYYQERYYLAGETFYPTCQERCRCQEGGTVNCEAFSCGPNEDCGVENGIQKCYPVGSATCSVAGGVHYLSFDQVPFDFHGTCTYTLAKTKASSQNLTPFTVNVENGAREDGKMSVSKMVSVSVHGVTLTFLKNKPGQVKVDDTLQLLPVTLSGGRLRAHPHGTRVLVQADFGLIVSYDFASRVTVTVPSNYQDGLSGLCGNYNDQKGDEFLLPDGRAVTDVNTFGAAWKVLVPGADGSCLDGCPGNKCPVCDERQKEVLKQRKYCGILSADDGPLSACHAAVDPKVYLSNCIYDSCLVDGDREVLCQSIQSYVSACQDAAVSFDSWRTPSFCPLTCPANSHYEFCADLCSISCAKITDPGNCPSTCAEGCQCDDGFFFDGRACVTAENCGCLWNGHYFKPHEKVLLNNCRESCTCIPGRGVKCEAQRCTADEECVTKDGVMRCIKKGKRSPVPNVAVPNYPQANMSSSGTGDPFPSAEGYSGKG
ncbi:IgGFc-binding protein-like [Tiliqua scincoides]|uniref:IgGFc-binding protein-like n=1 Tax=Tiliqua scincoides TaxID=71010 RepID=UPI003461D061